jgi:putative transposase
MDQQTVRKTFKYKLIPTPEQERALDRVLGLCRELYNVALEQRITAWQRCHVAVSRFQQEAELKAIRAELPDYATIHSHVLQDVLARLDRTYQAFFLRRTQERGARSRLVAEIFDAGGAILVVAPGDAPDPVGRVPSNASNRFGRQPTRQEPEEVPADPVERILRAPVASREFGSAQMLFEVDVSCHASLSTSLQRDPIVHIL